MPDSQDNEELHWTKSSYSGANECVEWLVLRDEVQLRHSLDPDGPRLRFTPGEWAAFKAAVLAGEV